MRAKRLAAVGVLGVLGTAALTGCGAAKADPVRTGPLAGLSAETILAEAEAAGKSAPSARTVLRAGAKGATATSVIAADRAGDCVGTISEEDPLTRGDDAESKARSGGRTQVLGQGGTMWVKTSASPAGSAADGKWIKGAAGSMAGSLAQFCQVGLGMLDRISSLGEGGDGRWVKAGGTTVNGVRAVLIRFESGAPADAIALDPPAAAQSVQVAVAAEGEPYLLSLEFGGGGSDAVLTFGDYGKPVQVTPPPADQVLDRTAALGATGN